MLITTFFIISRKDIQITAQVQLVHILPFLVQMLLRVQLLSATGTPDASADSAVTLANSNTITFTDGYANPELEPDSGNVIYIENRAPITRATDQTEDIKIVVEF
jgi:hypothetical protein